MDSAAVQALVEGINDIELIQYSQRVSRILALVAPQQLIASFHHTVSSACLMLYDHGMLKLFSQTCQMNN